jgi:hypothetical protein
MDARNAKARTQAHTHDKAHAQKCTRHATHAQHTLKGHYYTSSES